MYWRLHGQEPDLSPRAELSHMTPARFDGGHKICSLQAFRKSGPDDDIRNRHLINLVGFWFRNSCSEHPMWLTHIDSGLLFDHA